MNSSDVLQWLKRFTNDEDVIKTFEGTLHHFFLWIIPFYEITRVL
jgi:hypothetical protein